MWPSNQFSQNKEPYAEGLTPYKIDGKTFIFSKPRHLTPQMIILEKWALFEAFNTHLWGFQEYIWKNIHF